MGHIHSLRFRLRIFNSTPSTSSTRLLFGWLPHITPLAMPNLMHVVITLSVDYKELTGYGCQSYSWSAEQGNGSNIIVGRNRIDGNRYL